MKVQHTATWPRLFVLAGMAALASLATAAHAADGYNVSTDQEPLVHTGMNTVQVELALGRPAKNMQYANEAGPTWTYGVLGQRMTVFDVVFGADGMVISTSERLDESGHGHGDRR